MAAAAAAERARSAGWRRSRWRRGRPVDRSRLGRAWVDARPSGYLPGTVSRFRPSPRARRRARSTPFRARRGRTASSNMWSARRSTTSFRRCGGTSTATAFIRSKRGSAAAAFSTPAVSTRPIRGWIGPKVADPYRRALADRVAELWRLAAQRYFRRRAQPQNNLDSALLSWLFTACARRAHVGADRAEGPRPDGGLVLGSGRP